MIASLLVAALLAAPLSAHDPAPPQLASDPLAAAVYEQLTHGLPPAAVGQWVIYTLRGSGRPNDAFWRLAVVGKQKDAKGRDAVWLEMEFAQHANFVAPLFQMKMLVANLNGLQADGISRVILAIGAGKPQEVDPASFSNKNDKMPTPVFSRTHTSTRDGHPVTMRAGKRAHLMTSAGTVDALPVEVVYRQTVLKRYWVSKEIPILQLAKIEIPNLKDAMEVRDFGLDAKPMIHFPDPDAPKLTLEAGLEPVIGGSLPTPNGTSPNGGQDEPAPQDP